MHALGHTEANTLLVIHKMDTIKDFNADSRWNMLLSVVWKLQYITRYKSLFCKCGQILVRLRSHGWARTRVSSIKEHQRQGKSPAGEGSAPAPELCHLGQPGWLAAAQQGQALAGSGTARHLAGHGHMAAPSPAAAAASRCPGAPISPASYGFAHPTLQTTSNQLAGTCGLTGSSV